jgi:acyl carrier protein
MPTKDEITLRVRQIIADELSVPIEEVTPQAHIVEELGADSLDRAELSVAIEEEFGISLPSEPFERVDNVLAAVTKEVPDLTL